MPSACAFMPSIAPVSSAVSPWSAWVAPPSPLTRPLPRRGAGPAPPAGLPGLDLGRAAIHDHRPHAEAGRGPGPRRLGARRVVEEERVRELVGQERGGAAAAARGPPPGGRAGRRV